MLKKIAIRQFRKGMYIHELCGSWIDHPFWKKSFLVESDDDCKALLTSPITELIIDTDKGLDVLEPGVGRVSVSASAAAPTAKAESVAKAVDVIASVSMEKELDQASQIVARSRKAVMNMFNEARMGKAVDGAVVSQLVQEISDSVARNTDALIGLARLKNKDDYTYMHSVAVSALMIALARQLKLSEDDVKEAGVAGLLHDIGKMMIPSGILNKPDKLTDSEFATMKEHPQAGHKLLTRNPAMSPAALDVCLHHHEKMDGTGYPFRLPAEQISLMARMGAVCDVYDAITSNRPYKVGWGPAESIKKMLEWGGKHLDESVLQAFVKVVGIYPVGSLVMMKSGRIGIVVQQNDASLLLPTVRTFFSSKSKSYVTPELIDLSKSGHVEKIVSIETAKKWNLQNVDRYWLGGA